MKYITLAALALFAVAFSASAQANQLVGSYVAYISQADKYNSNGQRLTDPAAILRQDRANFHRFGKRDALDEFDCFFGCYRNRAAMERMLRSGMIERSAADAIVRGNALVHVAIYRSHSGCHFLRVSVLN